MCSRVITSILSTMTPMLQISESSDPDPIQRPRVPVPRNLLDVSRLIKNALGTLFPPSLPLRFRSVSWSYDSGLFVNKSKTMGLLDKLWDDTLAGPRPESGLSRLRKHSTFAFRSNTTKEEAMDGGSSRSYVEEEAPRVTRSIMIKRPAGCPSPGGVTPPSSLPSSPAGSTPPVSPFAGGKEWYRFRRKSSSDAYERGQGVVGIGPRSPPPPFEV